MDNYVYLVDGDGKDAEFKGFNNNINANVKAPYKVCTVHTEAPVEVQGVALVVVENRRAEVDGVGGVRLQGILDSHNDATATPDDRGFLLHRRRGKELLLLVLNLDILVELDVNLRRVERIYLGGEVITLFVQLKTAFCCGCPLVSLLT